MGVKIARIPTVVSTTGGLGTVAPTQSTPATPQKPRFLPNHIEEPKVLSRLLNDLVTHVDEATKGARQSPLSSFNILANITFTMGQTLELKHLLGRVFQGWIVIDAQTAAWSGYRTTLTAGKTPSTHLALVSANAGTYSFLVF